MPFILKGLWNVGWHHRILLNGAPGTNYVSIKLVPYLCSTLLALQLPLGLHQRAFLAAGPIEVPQRRTYRGKRMRMGY